MSTTDLGESLIGAYARHVEQCTIVLTTASSQTSNARSTSSRSNPRARTSPGWSTSARSPRTSRDRNTVRRVPAKLGRLREFAELTFPDEEHRFQWWSPYVNEGAITSRFEQLCADRSAEGRVLEFTINREVTRRIAQLVEHARGNTSTTNEPAYRMLQMLTHLRGDKPEL